MLTPEQGVGQRVAGDPGPGGGPDRRRAEPGAEAAAGEDAGRGREALEEDPIDTLFDILIEDQASPTSRSSGCRSRTSRSRLQQPWVSINNDSQGTSPDGLLGQEHPHPRAYGTFPRILRKYVREEHTLTLEDAIRKFTALPAQRMRLADRGVLKQGMWADVVVFDPDKIQRPGHLRGAEPALGGHAIRPRERRPRDRRRQGDQCAAGQGAARTGLGRAGIVQMTPLRRGNEIPPDELEPARACPAGPGRPAHADGHSSSRYSSAHATRTNTLPVAAALFLAAALHPSRLLSARQTAPEFRSLLRPEVAPHRPVPRRARQRRHRRARPADRLLLRLGRRRRLEDDQCRPHVEADLRLAAGRFDRRDRRRAVAARDALRRHRRGRHALADLATATACTSPPTPARRGRTSASTTPSRSATSSSIHAIRTSCSSRRSAMPTAPNPDRGVFRSRDGGKTWQKVLFKNENVGAIDLAFDPRNSQIDLRGLWNTRRPPWNIYPPSNGPGSGMFKSTDGGDDVEPADDRSAHRGLGRIGIAVAPTQPHRVYAIVDAEGRAGSIARTMPARRGRRCRATRASGDAAGTSARSRSIRRTPTSSTSRTRRCIARSTAARRWTPIKGSPGGDDYHQLWIDPDDPNRMILASDQGAVVSRRRRPTRPGARGCNQPTAQIYHVAPTTGFRTGSRARSRTAARSRVRSRGKFAGISMRDWEPPCAGGESGLHRARSAAPRDPLRRHGARAATCAPARRRTCRPSATCPSQRGTRGRMPLVFSKADPHVALFQQPVPLQDDRRRRHWTQISPDLTREDPGVPPNLDAATAADAPASTARAASSTRSRRRR